MLMRSQEWTFLHEKSPQLAQMNQLQSCTEIATLIEDAAKASGVLSQPWETKTANAVLNPFDHALVRRRRDLWWMSPVLPARMSSTGRRRSSVRAGRSGRRETATSRSSERVGETALGRRHIRPSPRT